MIDLAITPDNDCRDPYSLLNVLWVFKASLVGSRRVAAGPQQCSALAHVAGGDNSDRQFLSPSVNVVLVRLHNAGNAAVDTAPEFIVESPDAAKPGKQDIAFGPWTVTGTEPFADVKVEKGKATLHFSPKYLAAGEDRVVAVSLWREAKPAEVPRTAEEAVALRKSAERYWKQLDLPYDSIQIPDQGIQNLIEASLRGIDQNRDYKNGVPVYQVGPTGYRDISCADGSFFCELAILLGRAKDAADTLDYFLSFQRTNGRLWLYSRFLEREWLGDLGSGALCRTYRRHGLARKAVETRRGDGRLHSGTSPALDAESQGTELRTDARRLRRRRHRWIVHEYSNVLWNMAGLRAAIAGAKLLGKNEQAAAWQKEFDEMDGYFRKAIARDARRDKHGNLYLPNLMGSDGSVPPPQGQWAFLHSIFPGKLYEPKRPVGARQPRHARSGAGRRTPAGQRLGGRGRLALFQPLSGQCGVVERSRTKNRAPALCHRQPCSSRAQLVGGAIAARAKAPEHKENAAQLGFRRVRPASAVHAGVGARARVASLRGTAFEWTQPGMVTRMKDVLTEFGPISFALEISADGKQAKLKLDVPQRIRPDEGGAASRRMVRPLRHDRTADRWPRRTHDRIEERLM